MKLLFEKKAKNKYRIIVTGADYETRKDIITWCSSEFGSSFRSGWRGDVMLLHFTNPSDAHYAFIRWC